MKRGASPWLKHDGLSRDGRSQERHAQRWAAR
jgi:hypothetical protein